MKGTSILPSSRSTHNGSQNSTIEERNMISILPGGIPKEIAISTRGSSSAPAPCCSVKAIQALSALKKEYQSGRKLAFKPKQSRRIARLAKQVEGDGDVWVERFYRNQKGMRVYFYRSLRTNRCVLLEPPTGAQLIIFCDEVDESFPSLVPFAKGRLDRGLREIERLPAKPFPRQNSQVRKTFFGRCFR